MKVTLYNLSRACSQLLFKFENMKNLQTDKYRKRKKRIFDLGELLQNYYQNYLSFPVVLIEFLLLEYDPLKIIYYNKNHMITQVFHE